MYWLDGHFVRIGGDFALRAFGRDWWGRCSLVAPVVGRLAAAVVLRVTFDVQPPSSCVCAWGGRESLGGDISDPLIRQNYTQCRARAEASPAAAGGEQRANVSG